MEAQPSLEAVLAGRVRNLREDRGWSQRDAATRAGLSRAWWQRLEAGQLDPQLSDLLRLQRVFELATVEALLGMLPSEGFA
jgi:transcriptional regulator with XRE-family HTH domain